MTTVRAEPVPDGDRIGGQPDDGPPVPRMVRLAAMLVAFAAMVAFAVVLARLTLGSSAASEPLTHNNLRPGETIRDYLAQPALRDTVRQLGGNVVLGVPFGVLGRSLGRAVHSRRHHWWHRFTRHDPTDLG
jgi:hypothetical protein